jgi:hypothetical protein
VVFTLSTASELHPINMVSIYSAWRALTHQLLLFVQLAVEGWSDPTKTSAEKKSISRVTEIGGIFIKAKDPVAAKDWYKQHFGIEGNK